MNALPSRLVRLGFRCDPFPLLPRPELYYPEPEREQELKVLLHLLTYTHLLPVVEGPAGIGKTTFLQRLRDIAPRHWRTVFLTAPPDGMDETALLAALGEGFELPDGARDDPLFALQEHLDRLSERGDLPVLLIDDAHYLTPAALRLLAVLAVGDEQLPARLHAALAAERLSPAQIEAVRSLATGPGDAPDPLKTIHLLPFDRQQTHDYLAHRIRTCGGHPEALLDADLVARLHQAAQGLPGQLDALARAWLHEDERPAAPPPRRRRPVWPLLLLPVLAILLWPKDEAPPPPQDSPPQVTRALPLPLARDGDGVLRLDWSPLVTLLLEKGRGPQEKAAAFHATLARALARVAARARDELGIGRVGLSGGVFQNRLLTEGVMQELEALGLGYRPPPQGITVNDGSLSAGQLLEYGYGHATP